MFSRSRLAIAMCAALLGIFYLLGWFSFQTESATIDEPLHTTAAYQHLFEHDFRIDAEDPPLWQYWAMIPHHAGELLPGDPTLWQKQLHDTGFAAMITTQRLYETPGNDGAAFINSSRTMMLLIGVLLGAAIATWAWQLGGPIAAVIACTLFAFDPNFLGHSPLVKNDVSMSFLMLSAAWVAWSVGKRGQWWNVLLLCAICGIAAAVKFSGLLLLPIVGVILLIRAAMRLPWNFLGLELRNFRSRVVATIAIGVVAVATTYLLIWAAYGFRFGPTPTPGEMLNTDHEVVKLKQTLQYLRQGEWVSDSAAATLPMPGMAKVVLSLQSHHVLPQAWLYGFIFTYRTVMMRGTFLLGQYSESGWWYYFPLAMLFKTPLAMLAAVGVAIVGALSRKRQEGEIQWWSRICLGIPLVVYGFSALSSHLNLGLRHVLPLYPLIYLLTAIVLAKWKRSWVVWALAIGLMLETLAAFPHYISFFNVASRPYRLKLLSDSNFDWGQDLPYVAAWQQKHPASKLYLGYFGTVDPAFYDIHYTNLPGGFFLNRNFQWPNEPGVIAISATLLQGVDCPPSLRAAYAPFREHVPREILGDTIYLYDWPLR